MAKKRATRTRHRGSIYQRSDGRWCASLSLGSGPDGKRKRLTIYAPTMEEARAKLEAATKRVSAGLSPASDKLTLGAFARDWIEAALPSVRPSTHLNHLWALRHFEPILGHLRMEAISLEDLRRWLATMSTAPGSTRKIAGILGSIFRAAVAAGKIPKSPMIGIKLPKTEARPRSTFDSKAARAYLEACREHRLGIGMELALLTGIRQGEALGLLWECVDLEAGTIRIEASLQKLGKNYRLMPPKTKAGKRMVALPAILIERLRLHKARQAKARLLAGGLWVETGLVVAGPRGRPVHRRMMGSAHAEVERAAGLPHIRFHDLRHSCATLLLEMGESPKVVAEILGHTSTRITLDLYSHVSPALQRGAMSKIDHLLRG